MIQYPWLISLQFLSALSVMLGPNLIVTITMCKKKMCEILRYAVPLETI